VCVCMCVCVCVCAVCTSRRSLIKNKLTRKTKLPVLVGLRDVSIAIDSVL